VPYPYTSLILKGSFLILFPVRSKIALHNAGANGGREVLRRNFFKSPSPQIILIIEEAAKAPSQREGEK